MTVLSEKLKSLPLKPGVYLFRDAKNQIIYIGKALSLKHRVASYFQNKNHDPKTKELVKNIADIQTILVNSEFEALLLEAKLIKQHQPKFNVNLKDDKSYLYILISKEDPQRIYVGRKSDIKEGNFFWYGPFTTSADAREILRVLRRIFPYRSCKNLPKKPCLYYHLKLCPAPCYYPVSNYQETVKKIRQILSGKTQLLLKSLEKKLKQEAKNLNFEEAAMVKKQIDAITAITLSWKNIPQEKKDKNTALQELRKILVDYQGIDPLTLKRIEGYDISNLGNKIIVGSMVVFDEGEPNKSQYRMFNLKENLQGQDDPEGIRKIIERRFKHQDWVFPQLILIDGGKTQVSAAFFSLKKYKIESQISLLGITKEEEVLIIPKITNHEIVSWKSIKLKRSSAALQLLQSVRDEAHRFAQNYYKLLYQKRFFSN